MSGEPGGSSIIHEEGGRQHRPAQREVPKAWGDGDPSPSGAAAPTRTGTPLG